jgi:hypothetical protein
MKPATKRRIEELQRRKNFLPTLAVTFVLWLFVAVIVYFSDPLLSGAIPLFFVTFFFATMFTVSLLLANTRRGILISLVITIFLLLRYLQVGNLLNFVLLAAAAVAFEFYLRRA